MRNRGYRQAVHLGIRRFEVITDNKFFQEVRVFGNTKHNKFHASALDFVVETMEFDYLMA